MINKERVVITIDEMLLTPIGSLANYSPDLLYQLQLKVNDNLSAARRAKMWLENAIGLKYETHIRAKRLRMEKDTGVVHIEDEGYRLTCDVKKRVIWEQEILAKLAAEIAQSGEDVEEYLDIEYWIPERRYNDFPASVRKMFDTARHLEMANPSYTLAKVE